MIRGKAIKRRERRNIELTTFPYPLELPVTTVPDPDPWDMIKIFHVDVIEVFKVSICFFSLLIMIIMSRFNKLYING